MSIDPYLAMAIATFAIFIAWRLYRSHSKQYIVFISLFVVVGIVYSLWGYTVLELLATLSICLIACIATVSALELAIQGSKIKPLIELALPGLQGLFSKIYRGVLSYTLLFISSVAIAALLSIAVRNFLERVSVAIVMSFIVGYVLKRVGKLSSALIVLMVFVLAAYITAPSTVVNNFRGFEEWLEEVEAVIGGVG